MANERPPEPTTANERPPEPTTKSIPQSEILSGLLNKLTQVVERLETKQDAGFVAVKADFNLLAGQFESLEVDVRGLQSWRVRTDDKMARNSDRAKSFSDADLKLAADQGLEIAKNAEQDAAQDKKIDETHALALSAVALGTLANDELAKQSTRAGIGVGLIKWVGSTDGRTTILSITTLAGVVYATLKTSGILK